MCKTRYGIYIMARVKQGARLDRVDHIASPEKPVRKKTASVVAENPIDPYKIFAGGPTIVFRWKAEKNWPVEYVSPNIRQFGFKEDDFIAGDFPFSTIVHPDDLKRISEEVKHYSKSGVPSFEQEYRLICPDDKIRWIYDFTLVVRNEKGRITHYHGYILDITERKKAQQELSESLVRYKAMVDAYDGLLYICSQDYIVEYANTKLIERTGYNPIGQKCFKALHGRKDLCPWCVNERVLKGETVRWETKSPRDDRWYYVVNVPIRHEDGAISKMAMIQDITERKQNEALLHKRDAILSAINFSAHEFMKNSDWTKAVNNVLDILGRSVKTDRVMIFENSILDDGRHVSTQRFEWVLPGMTSQLYNPTLQNFSLSENGFERWEKAFKKNKPIHGHVREFPDLEKKLLQDHGIQSLLSLPVYIADHWWGFIVLAQLVTERTWLPTEIDTLKVSASILGAAIKRSMIEDELNLLTGAIAQSDDSILITDRKGIIHYANPAFEKTTGYTIKEVKGKTPRILNSGKHDKAFFQKLWKTLMSGKPYRAEFINKRKDGTLYRQSETLTPVKNKQGTLTHFISSGRFVEEYKE